MTREVDHLKQLLAEHQRLRDLSEERHREILESRRYRLATYLSQRVRGVLRRRPAQSAPQPAPVDNTKAPRRPLETAAIVDPFTFHCLAPELALTQLGRDTWQDTLKGTAPVWLFVESCWLGQGGTWRREVELAHLSPDRSLEKVVNWFRSRGLPTVFWAKEDPVNFALFLPAAELFDAVFTTAEESIALYREALGHDRVELLPFAAQPALHHASTDPPDRSISFAGSWMGEKYPARARDLDWLLAAARPFGLDIWDRHAGGQRAFPPRWKPCVRGSLPYPQVIETIRRYKIVLNVSSVTQSATMLPRRVFELLACGVCVVSTPNRALEELLPGLVPIVRTPAEARATFEELLGDDEQRAEIGRRGREAVLKSHTYEHRVDQVLDALRRWGFSPDNP